MSGFDWSNFLALSRCLAKLSSNLEPNQMNNAVKANNATTVINIF